MSALTRSRKASLLGWQIGISALALVVTSSLVQLYRFSLWVENWHQFATQSVAVAITMLLLVTLSIVWTALVVGVLGLFLRQRAALASLALVPWLAYLGHTLVSDDQAKPSEHFERSFGIALPTSASNLRARLPNLADPGHFAFSFQCAPADTLGLIAALQLEPWPDASDTHPPYLFRLSAPATNEPGEDLQFWLNQHPSGLGVFLATNSTRTFVLLAREPGWGKEE
jgi:hypothetical protein